MINVYEHILWSGKASEKDLSEIYVRYTLLVHDEESIINANSEPLQEIELLHIFEGEKEVSESMPIEEKGDLAAMILDNENP